jgi:serine/threonine protein kinase
MKKLATGGGGEIFLARVMTAFLKEKTGNLVIQKIVFIKNQMAQEAFYQEVGIMIMLSSFPNFCRIIAYTEKPASMILQYYPDGSLQDYIKDNKYGRDLIVKFSKEISSALRIMHSYFLAHCDIKTQNGLIEVEDGVPTC